MSGPSDVYPPELLQAVRQAELLFLTQDVRPPEPILLAGMFSH